MSKTYVVSHTASWSHREASVRIPVPHAPLSPGKPERTTTSCAHNTTADARSNRALLPHTQQQGSRNPSLRVALQLPRPRTRSGNWFVCDLQICCHFTAQNSETDLKTNDETITFLICLFVLFPQLDHRLILFLYFCFKKHQVSATRYRIHTAYTPPPAPSPRPRSSRSRTLRSFGFFHV